MLSKKMTFSLMSLITLTSHFAFAFVADDAVIAADEATPTLTIADGACIRRLMRLQSHR